MEYKIFLEFHDKKHEIRVRKDMTIQMIEEYAIANLIPQTSEIRSLMFAGKRLESDKTLEYYHILDGSTIHIFAVNIYSFRELAKIFVSESDVNFKLLRERQNKIVGTPNSGMMPFTYMKSYMKLNTNQKNCLSEITGFNFYVATDIKDNANVFIFYKNENLIRFWNFLQLCTFKTPNY